MIAFWRPAAFLLLALLLLVAPPVAAAPTASAFVAELTEQAVTELNRTKAADTEREEQFRRLLLKGFDVETISRFVLGRHWRSATPALQSRYQALFPDYVVRVLAKLAPVYNGETLVILQEHRIEPDGDALVRTRVRRPDGEVLLARIDFRVRATGAGPRIIDVVVEGVSMITTQRAEFDSVVGREGMAGLIAMMERMQP
jgi:phospholipid transport system substrate-binding protein